MRFRQVHLDFHTSEAIPGIGSKFDKKQFQEMLRLGHVDSVTVFAKCHHGWAYHPSEANEMHPNLNFDLLGEMIAAAHEIAVKTPVYLSAGLDEKMARRQPNWLMRAKDETMSWTADFLTPGYHQFCMNTPYLDYLLEQIREVVANYDADGIFLDIVGVRECYCQYCVASIRERGQDPRDAAAMQSLWEDTYKRYADECREVIHDLKPGLTIFHNGGHIRRGRRDLAAHNTHLELESLPTGGWGYDHFPLSARYAQTLGMDYLGMTGKFHTMWGEFGGYKHPNALRYETALSLANGARCSIGDQLHPEGKMDEATYKLIGTAYREVEEKEAWCSDTLNVADIALLSAEAVEGLGFEEGIHKTVDADAGAVRILLEGHYLFDVVDLEADFSRYKVLILPDRVSIGELLRSKVDSYVQAGGKVLATGASGMNIQRTAFELELGAVVQAEKPTRPSYIVPSFKVDALGSASYVMYGEGYRVEQAHDGTELAGQEDAYFNRDVFTFCSHQYAPNRPVRAGAGMTEGKHGIYIAWHVFEDYAEKGSLVAKEIVKYALDRLLPVKTLRTTLPAQGVVTLQKQQGESRFVNHLLYASPVSRGKGVEIIEDLVPLHQVEVTFNMPDPVRKVYLAPQMEELPFTRNGSEVSYTVPVVNCHQMIVLDIVDNEQ